MKLSLVILFSALTYNSFGQISLSKGQKFTVKTTTSQEIDMGMGMEMKNNSSSQTNFAVLEADSKAYSISSTLTGLKIAMDFMGQQSTYDSDLKEDSASELGKSIKTLHVPDTLSVDKNSGMANTGKKDSTSSKDETSNPMEKLLESFGENNTGSGIEDAFFIIPAGKKAGDSWVDSVTNNQQKSIKAYTIKSIEKNVADVTVIITVQSNIQTEVQGMQIMANMTTKTTGDIIADTETSLVSKRSTKADISGNLELMGQSMPISGRATTVSVYEY